jgi:hypothetical protein
MRTLVRAFPCHAPLTMGHYCPIVRQRDGCRHPRFCLLLAEVGKMEVERDGQHKPLAYCYRYNQSLQGKQRFSPLLQH